MTELEQEMLQALMDQHEAIDRLFALLIVAHKDDARPFYPSQCGQPWAATLKAHALIERLRK